MGYEQYLEPIIEYFSTGPYYEEVYMARQEYFARAGMVYDDDPEFELRMNIFMDWYLFDRDLPRVDLSPAQYYVKLRKDSFSSQESTIYQDFCSTVHSIFCYRRKSWWSHQIVIDDLFSKQKFFITAHEPLQGFSSGDIFEARIVSFQGQYHFTRGFCFHPTEVKPFILKEIKKVRFQEKILQNKLILELAHMKLKHMRFNHINIHKVYQFSSRI